MNSATSRESNPIQPLHVVMICLVVMTVAGGFLLMSVPKPTAPVDGAIEWREESPLRAVVQLLCLNYQVPTVYAGEVKNYILGLGSGLAILALTVALLAASRSGEDETIVVDEGWTPPASGGAGWKRQIAPLGAAQVLVVFYVLWSFASTRWSLAPELALGGSILLTVHLLWAFGVGYGLNPAAARLASMAIVGIGAVTASIAVWYYYGRNPTLRAGFPLGNPLFLAACLLPSILLAVALILEKVSGPARTAGRSYGLIVPAGVAIGVCLWAFYLADSRGPGVGLLFGAIAVAFFALRGRWKWIPVAAAMTIAVVGCWYFLWQSDAFSPTGRSATVRLRLYAWSYAWRMFTERPLTGWGQGAFVLTGDSYVVDDVLRDPLVFESRVEHAHNEWIEVAADLGSIGIVLVIAALLLTFRAGIGALASGVSGGQRWALIGAMGALVGLIVEECFGVGLRVCGVGTVFYTLLGLIWVLSRGDTAVMPLRRAATPLGRTVIGVVGGLVGMGTLVITHQDFAAGRSEEEAKDALAEGRFDDAIRLASRATHRLNPQRALTNMDSLARAHLQTAQAMQRRAADRERRAKETDPPNARLLALAQEDYGLSDEHCQQGSDRLSRLVTRAPGFINHGLLGCWLSLTRAANAGARGDAIAQEALVRDALVAVKRELRRQPYVPEVAVNYVRLQREAATSDTAFAEMMDVFARPLRHSRIGAMYVELLAELAADPTFDGRLNQLIENALRALKSPAVDEQSGEPIETWAPEKLRLAATVRFLRGDYAMARAALELAASAYDGLAPSAPLGAASAYAELADCRFFKDLNDASAALAAAGRALDLAPQSRQGRLLAASVKTRMIDYALAAGQEAYAERLVRENATGPLGEGEIRGALGLRYARMTESLLGRRDAGGLLRVPPAALMPKLQQWIARAIELNPNDAVAHYLAADLWFYVGDDKATAAHLRQALELGLSVDLVVRFLQTARDRNPDSKALKTLWDSVAPPPSSSEPSEPTVHPPGEEGRMKDEG